MHFYKAYGLGIHSRLLLPELLGEPSVPMDILIQFGRLPQPPADREALDRHYWKQGQDIYLFWQSLGIFRIRGGREITVDPLVPVESAKLRPPVLGICMAALLHQRHFLILHASAAALPGGAVAFLGDKGWGKSTMNAALHQRGHTFVTDDILAIDTRQKTPMVYPAFPQMKLWPSAVTALGRDPQSLPKLVPQLEKRQHLFDNNVAQRPVPLKALYLLGKGPTLSIEPLIKSTILGHLFLHSYSGRCGKALLQHGEGAHFLQCMTLVNTTPVYHLRRPSDLSLLSTIADAVEAHASETRYGKEVDRAEKTVAPSQV